MKRFVLPMLTMIFIFGSGCAVQLPTNSYTPQNYVRTSGKADMGNFIYMPYQEGNVKKPNQIQNTAAGQIFGSSGFSVGS